MRVAACLAALVITQLLHLICNYGWFSYGVLDTTQSLSIVKVSNITSDTVSIESERSTTNSRFTPDVPLIRKLQLDFNKNNTTQTRFIPKDTSFLEFSTKSHECFPTDPHFDGPTCCTISVTERYCQTPCTEFGVGCSMDCDLSILREIPRRCNYNKWQDVHSRSADLAGRKVIWVGDSLMRQLFEHTVSMSQGDGAQISVSRSLAPLQCRNVNSTTASHELCFFETARRSGTLRISRGLDGALNKTDCHAREANELLDVNLGDALECMSIRGLITESDIVIANAGVHHPNSASLAQNVKDFIAWRDRLGKNSSIGRSPYCVAWRQTLPQHFDAPSGDWDGGLQHSASVTIANARNHSTSCCKPLNDPFQLTQKHNPISDPLVDEAKIPNIQMWSSAAGLWKFHKDCEETTADCTHWASPALEVLTRLFLHRLEKECKQQRLSYTA